MFIRDFTVTMGTNGDSYAEAKLFKGDVIISSKDSQSLDTTNLQSGIQSGSIVID